jgi:hypothetical protein
MQACNISYSWSRYRIAIQDLVAQKHEISPEKQTESKSSVGMAKVVEHGTRRVMFWAQTPGHQKETKILIFLIKTVLSICNKNCLKSLASSWKFTFINWQRNITYIYGHKFIFPIM